jgi:hypothetical protein
LKEGVVMDKVQILFGNALLVSMVFWPLKYILEL